MASRRRTGRSESTRNDLLWQASTQDNLTKLASKGDVQGVANILNILQKAETESLIAAAKAGHEEVLQYLLGMGDPDLDPEPVRNLKSGFNTPMLAAIGRGHIDVVKLLANQSGFNPTRKWRDRTYFELAEERKGQDWQQERDVLRAAYERFMTSKGRKTGSPRKNRDLDKAKSRITQRSSSPALQKRGSTSPSITHKTLTAKGADASPNDKRKAADTHEKRRSLNNQPDLNEMSVAVSSDQDGKTTPAKNMHRVRRSQSDAQPPKGLDPESTQKRRRLVTGKEHRRNKSAAPEGTSSGDESVDIIEVKQEDRQVPALKRARSSLSPGRKLHDGDKVRTSSKKRRTVLESSPEEARVTPKQRVPTPVTVKPSDGTVMEGIEETVTTDVSAPAVKSEEQDEPPAAANGTTGTEEAPSVPTGDQKPGDVELLPDAPDNLSDLAVDQEQPGESHSEPEAANEAVLESEEQKALREVAERAAATKAAEEDAAREAARRLDEERTALEQRALEEAELKKKAEEEAAAQRKAEEEQAERLRLEAERRLQQEALAAERKRREALPIVLCKCAEMIDSDDATIRDATWLAKFLPLFTVTSGQIIPDHHESMNQERWIPSYQAAGLLASKDLGLQTFPFLQRRAVTDHEKICLWRVSRNMLSFEYQANGFNTSVKQASQRENEQRPKFLAMTQIHWVKLSDFENQACDHAHLRNLVLQTQPISLRAYSDLAQTQSPPQANGSTPPATTLTNGVYTLTANSIDVRSTA